MPSERPTVSAASRVGVDYRHHGQFGDHRGGAVMSDLIIHTPREFSGTLTFDTPVETRTYLRRLVVVWSRDLAGRSAMHSAYPRENETTEPEPTNGVR